MNSRNFSKVHPSSLSFESFRSYVLECLAYLWIVIDSRLILFDDIVSLSIFFFDLNLLVVIYFLEGFRVADFYFLEYGRYLHDFTCLTRNTAFLFPYRTYNFFSLIVFLRSFTHQGLKMLSNFEKVSAFFVRWWDKSDLRIKNFVKASFFLIPRWWWRQELQEFNSKFVAAITGARR